MWPSDQYEFEASVFKKVNNSGKSQIKFGFVKYWFYRSVVAQNCKGFPSIFDSAFEVSDLITLQTYVVDFSPLLFKEFFLTLAK